MKWLKLFENFNQEEIDEFMSVIRDKVLELSDVGFNIEVEDKNSEPLLENMIRVTIDRDGRNPFEFSDVADISADILLTNMEMNLYKKIHVIVTPSHREDGRSSSGGVRLSWIFSGDECIWSYENEKMIKMQSLTPLNLDCKCVELYFDV
jgi:hypothetical protein